MSDLFTAMNSNVTKTENGDVAFGSTLSHCLDFFYKAPVSRNQDISNLFFLAMAEHEEVAIRTLLWLRDAREGAGERDTFRALVAEMVDHLPSLARRVMLRIPELGRFDDLEIFFGTDLESAAAQVWVSHIAEGNALAAKWAPRKDKKGAKPLRNAIGMNERDWRQFVVSNSDTLEQKMCAKDFENIDFGKQPSLAMSRNASALKRNSVSYSGYLEALTKGEAKVNAGAIFPHDVVKAMKEGNIELANAQWEALPDFLEGSKYRNILPVVDVSGSMTCTVSGSTTAMDVAVGLGLYCSSRSTGAFKDKFITFSETPSLQLLSGNLYSKYKQLYNSKWGFSTDLDKVFDLIVTSAVASKVPKEEMPEVILIPSDMQFNSAVRVAGERTSVSNRIKHKFIDNGYDVPAVIYWDVTGRDNFPATAEDKNVALVSGFSPSLLKGVLSGEIDPITSMLRVVTSERYSY